MKYKIPANWENYIPGKGCECFAYNRYECGCDVDWTDKKVYELQAEVNELLEKIKELEKGYYENN